MANTSRFTDETLAELLAGYEKPEDLLGKGGILEQLTKALVERALGAELSHHLGYAKGEGWQQKRENQRNGYSKKRLATDLGELEIAIPCDREGSFEPQLVPKGERRLSGFDEPLPCRRGQVSLFVDTQWTALPRRAVPAASGLTG